MPPRRRPQQCDHPSHLHELTEYMTTERTGWTLWREIYGTFIGVLPFLLLAFGAWMNMSERVRVAEVQIVANSRSHDQEIATIKANMEDAKKQTDRDRAELREQLGNISRQIEALQKDILGHARGR